MSLFNNEPPSIADSNDIHHKGIELASLKYQLVGVSIALAANQRPTIDLDVISMIGLHSGQDKAVQRCE